jgi:hypothetical protein
VIVEISEALVNKLLDTVDAGLVSGLGEPVPGKMCVEAAISYALGERHGDTPSCVAPSVRSGQVTLNDSHWSSPAARAEGLRRVAIAQLGSKGVIDERRYARVLVEQTIKVILPAVLRAAARRNPDHAAALESAASECEATPTKNSASRACDVANLAHCYSAATAANYARAAAIHADSIPDCAEGVEESFITACINAAATATNYAAATAANNAAAAIALYGADKQDHVLMIMAGLMENALRECGSPGCEWLWLCEE